MIKNNHEKNIFLLNYGALLVQKKVKTMNFNKEIEIKRIISLGRASSIFKSIMLLLLNKKFTINTSQTERKFTFKLRT